jgi:hypothetical protein
VELYKVKIVGNGDIASALKDLNKDRWIFFASGVSNSRETDEDEYAREMSLLLEQNRSPRLVYFSSLAALKDRSRYLDHKRDMERLVRLNFPKYNIVRIGNITWGDNPHTLINYLRAHPEAEIKDEYRYIVDKPEFLYWLDLLPGRNCEISIPGRRMKVQEVFDEYCRT